MNRALQLNISAATFESSGINTGIELRLCTEAFLGLRNGLDQFKVVLADWGTYLKYNAPLCYLTLWCVVFVIFGAGAGPIRMHQCQLPSIALMLVTVRSTKFIRSLTFAVEAIPTAWGIRKQVSSGSQMRSGGPSLRLLFQPRLAGITSCLAAHQYCLTAVGAWPAGSRASSQLAAGSP